MVLRVNIDFVTREITYGAPSTQWWTQLSAAIVFGLAFATVLTLIFRRLDLPIQTLVGFLVLAMLGTEVIAWLRRSAPIRYRYFVLSLGLIAVAATFSALDASRVFCDPDHFLQGHAIWHVLSALSLLASFKFYDQFAPLLLPPSTAR